MVSRLSAYMLSSFTFLATSREVCISGRKIHKLTTLVAVLVWRVVMAEPVISEDDRFASMRNREVFYMPIPETQHPPATQGDGSGGGVHVVKCKGLLALNFMASNWTGSDVSFGAAQPTEFARDNVSLLLKVVQWAIQARLAIYIETLYDEVLAKATGKIKERGKRLFLPVPETRFVLLVCAAALHLRCVYWNRGVWCGGRGSFLHRLCVPALQVP